MRHYYKSHGKHCYLRSFQSKCPKCNASVLYWECTHGSKVFFEYPPYGKLVRHYCRYSTGKSNIKKNYQIIVKKPKSLLENQSPSCPICGKLFKNINNLEDHLENLKKRDIYHKLFIENRISFEDENKEYMQTDSERIRSYNKPKFGKISIKKEKKND
ncbi:MAG: hypothetical protein JSV23_04450 [Promethearchaeota archaeon]|nr:MAG: hypothetical protein JSV23_04450 [Candidatus Lokiarchaeota archaeon]